MTSNATGGNLRDSADDPLMSTKMSEFELASVVLQHSLFRWIEHCAKTAGIDNISSSDLLVLHFVIYRGKPVTVSNIAFALSIQEVHLVTYSAKKLVKLGMLKSKRNGKEILFSSTKTSEAQYARYMELRKQHLIHIIENVHQLGLDLDALTGKLRALSGIYEQAARSIALSA